MVSKHKPCAADIALAPELAVLHVLDAALAMARKTLMAAHYNLADPTCPDERLAADIIGLSRKLHRILARYAKATTCPHINLVDH
jgi:hypothetical protein